MKKKNKKAQGSSGNKISSKDPQAAKSRSADSTGQSPHHIPPGLSAQTKMNTPLDLSAQTKINIPSDLSAQTKIDIPPDLSAETKINVSPDLDAQTKIDIPPDLSAQTKINIPPDLSAQTKINIPPDLSAQTKINIPPDLDAQTKINIPPDLSAETKINIPPDLSASTKLHVAKDAAHASAISPQRQTSSQREQQLPGVQTTPGQTGAGPHDATLAQAEQKHTRTQVKSPPGQAQQRGRGRRAGRYQLPPPEKRKNFGRYQIVGILGKGAMARVYRIYHPELDMLYALKILAPSSMDREGLQRFKREAQVVAKLKHPNIVAIHDMGMEKGHWYIVMDLVEGQSLDKLMARGQLSLSQKLEIMSALAAAVHYAHEMGVIHRDIKPSNVMIDQDGRPLLMDFGVARPVELGGELTRRGQIIGTPGYMSPEQAQGRIDELDGRTDVYALGAVLYELLTGHHPIEGASLATLLFNIMRKQPIPPRERNPEIPEAVEAICLKALAKKPAQRFQTAAQMQAAIDAYLQGQVPATPVEPDAVEGDSKAQSSTSAPAQEVVPLEPPSEGEKRIGKYRLIKEIAKGGMGVIYLAEDLQLKRQVALKYLIAGSLASSEDEKRFLREARMAARLVHPHIVQVYDIGRYEDGLYFTMEYVQAPDLGTVLREQGEQLSTNCICKITASILDGLAYAHDNGVIHRDIKPANIMVTDDLVKITDFGLARDIDQKHFTQSGLFLGTPAYTPPEQIQGQVEKIGPHSDTYAVGIILFEMLTGTVPFLGESFAELARKVVYDDPIPPRSLNPNIPVDLQTICLKAIEKLPQHRYPSAQVFRQDLLNFIAYEPIWAAPPSLGRKLHKLARHHTKKLLALVGLLLFSIIAYLYVAKQMALRVERQRQQQEVQQAYQTALDYLKEPHSDKALNQAQALQKQIATKDAQRAEALNKQIKAYEQKLAQWREQQQQVARQKQLEQLKLSYQQFHKAFKDFQNKWRHSSLPHKRIKGYQTLIKDLQKFEEELKQSQDMHLAERTIQPYAKALATWQTLLKNMERGRLVQFCLSDPASLPGWRLTLWRFDADPQREDQILAKGDSIYQGPLANFEQPLQVDKYYHYRMKHQDYAPVKDAFYLPNERKIHLEKIICLPRQQVPQGMVLIQGGLLGARLPPCGYKKGVHYSLGFKVAVQPFLLDRYEVTNAQYQQFLNQQDQAQRQELTPPNWYGAQFPPGRQNYPVVVSSKMAEDYARWAGKRLPTIYEWLLTARGKRGKRYAILDETRTQNFGICSKHYESYVRVGTFKGPLPVGKMPYDRSLYGIYDMGGNLMEWVVWPTKPKQTKSYALCGGCWGFSLRSANINRFCDSDFKRFVAKKYTGLRCARDLPGCIPIKGKGKK